MDVGMWCSHKRLSRVSQLWNGQHSSGHREIGTRSVHCHGHTVKLWNCFYARGMASPSQLPGLVTGDSTEASFRSASATYTCGKARRASIMFPSHGMTYDRQACESFLQGRGPRIEPVQFCADRWTTRRRCHSSPD